MERTEETLKARVREAPLTDRLSECRKRIGKMCAEGRAPRMCIPVQHDDDDFFICTTLADAQATIAALEQRVKELKQWVQDQSTANLETMRHMDEMQSRAMDAESQLAQRTAELERVRDQYADLRKMVLALPKVEAVPMTDAGWTRERPTAAGWYWFRDNKKDPPDVHWLSLIDGKLRVFTMSNENCVEHIDDYTGEWQGPLTPNEATE